jgi:hypothetical protein
MANSNNHALEEAARPAVAGACFDHKSIESL